MPNRVRFCALFLVALAGACSSGPHPAPLNLPPPAPPLSNATPSLRVADTALQNGAPLLALQIADQKLAANANDREALLRKAEALYALKRNEEAEAVFTQVLVLDPGNVPALIGVGRIRLARDPGSAADAFMKALARDPRNVAALNDLGIARDLLGEHGEAQEAYRKVLALAPGDLGARVNLGLSLALSGHAREAIDTLRPIASLPDLTPRMREDLAAGLALAGEDEAARSMMAQDLDPERVAEAMSGLMQLRSYTPPAAP
jgi:Flp pilus assembly protein TadD